MPSKAFLFLCLLAFGLISSTHAESTDQLVYWMKLKAHSKFERSVIADTGVAIETVADDFVTATGTQVELRRLEKMNFVEVSFPIQTDAKDFPAGDGAFHDEARLKAAMDGLVEKYPSLVRLSSIGKTVEGRDIWVLRISGNLAQADQLPAILYMGGHHAREHLSVETPFRIWEILLERYAQGDPRVRTLIDGRDIHLIPAVNPDGLSYDIESGRYRHWRKNRIQNDNGSYGVDLNRNYDYQWGTTGASASPSSETFRGKSAFSEPETRAIRDYVEAHENITILLSFHTYSQLILYPWGYTYDSIANDVDRRVHETMAATMAKWNGYTPMQSSGLYTASGDATDWSYGVHGIISFTFELDPGRWGGGGFYPGANQIPLTVQKNIEPVLYLLEYAANPYGVIQ
ncbi:MAG TPA: M14 family metallopeptidase [Pseudobdellovibrionaceae bacterium]|nr:M14 family metallopeptidase [Pseudobdellovibrionaceae bacterium]